VTSGSDPFFVVGMGRSGTTLLRMMLTHHPRLALPYESGFLTKYYDEAEAYAPLDADANLSRLIGAILAEPNLKKWDHAFSADRILAAVTTRTVPGVVDAIYSEYATVKGKARWGDKSDYLDRIHLLHQMFPAARFVHIIRDGRDVALSVLKLDWGPNDIVRAAEWWDSYVWLARRVGAVLGPERYLEVQYERLVGNPVAELQRCCTFLGEDYSPAMLEYPGSASAAIPADTRALHHGVDAKPYQQRVFAWKREMHPADVALFNRHAGRMLTELGYDVSPPDVGLPRVALRYLSLVGRRLLVDRPAA
jgi:Sulfotransferase family